MKLNQATRAFILFHLLCLTRTETELEIEPFKQKADQLGLECEVHEVTTEDGYVIKLFHLPGDKTRPVYLLSGTFGSADDYIARGNTSLVAVLVGAGYDVWAGNWRGCKYGRSHLTLDPDRDHKFWDYSIHEYAAYDIPAQIDYILNKTESKRVACIGWSLGSTVFFILGAIKPEYADKIAVLISLCPIGYMHNSVTLEQLIGLYPVIDAFLRIMDIHEIPGGKSTLGTILRYVCSSKELGNEICMNKFIFPTCGGNNANIEPQFVPELFKNFPTSISHKVLNHGMQILRERRISAYDYGPFKNNEKYGTEVAPDYELSKNNMSIVMLSGKDDLLSTLPDVELLKALLPNVVDHVLMKPAEFGHFDFPFANESYEIVYKPYILKYLKKFA